MKKTQKFLMMWFVCFLVMTAVIILLFETGVLCNGDYADNEKSEFIVTMVMELITLGTAFLALRLFKFERIKKELVSRKTLALRKWGIIRLSLLQIPLAIDTLLYYIYMKPTFCYLAIILVLCLPFVYPSMDRCLTETEEASVTEDIAETEES